VRLYVVADRMILGRGLFGAFSTEKKALAFCEEFEHSTGFVGEIRDLPVTGECSCPGTVFAAHTYDGLYDLQMFDSLYGEQSYAREAAGSKGWVVELHIDAPEHRRLVEDEE
jgi:hypothetical protein